MFHGDAGKMIFSLPGFGVAGMPGVAVVLAASIDVRAVLVCRG
jgi:hypothetical protein